MEKLIDVMFNPSSFDSRENYIGSTPESSWLLVYTHNRDSDLLTESNWDSILKALGGESDDVWINRVGHWAVGWVEYLCVRENSDKQQLAEELHDSLYDYPVINEEDYCQREHDEAQRVWANCYNEHERIEYIRKYRSQFEFHNWQDLMECVRGKHFCGYESDLIY